MRERHRDVAAQIRAARNALGMTQEQLALLIGTTQDRVSRWESGSCRPDLEHLADIVAQLKTRIHFDLRGSSIVVEVADLRSPLISIGDSPLRGE